MPGIHSTAWRVALYAVSALLIAYTFLTITSMPVHHDIAWPLYVGGEILRGARPYIDIIEVHPPLIVWYTLAAHMMARLFSVSPILGYHLLTLTVCLVSLFLCWRVLRGTAESTRAATLLGVTVLLFPLVGYSFGQEEHLMLSLALPYLFVLFTTLQGRPPERSWRVAVGLLAGVGFAMKPLYGVAWLALESYHAWARGWRRTLFRTELLFCALVLLVYPLAVLLLTPNYVTVANWAASVYYYFHPTPLPRVVLSSGTVLAVLAICVHALVRRPSELAELRRLLVIFLVAGVVVVLAQRKGWSYHWYPASAAAVLVLYLAALDRLRSARLRPRVISFALAAATLLLVLAGIREVERDRASFGTLAGSPYYLPRMRELVGQHAPAGPLMAFTTTMQIAFPLVNYSGAQWASRFSTLWLLPGLYANERGSAGRFPYHSLEALPPLEKYLLDAVYEDMRRHRPRLLVIDQAPPAAPLRGFNYIEYFGRDSRIRSLLLEYTPIDRVGRYLIFKRMSP